MKILFFVECGREIAIKKYAISLHAYIFLP